MTAQNTAAGAGCGSPWRPSSCASRSRPCSMTSTCGASRRGCWPTGASSTSWPDLAADGRLPLLVVDPGAGLLQRAGADGSRRARGVQGLPPPPRTGGHAQPAGGGRADRHGGGRADVRGGHDRGGGADPGGRGAATWWSKEATSPMRRTTSWPVPKGSPCSRRCGWPPATTTAPGARSRPPSRPTWRQGAGVLEAVRGAKSFVARGLAGAAGWRLGAGHGPIDHFGWSGGT